VKQFSFGKKLSMKMFYEFKRLAPHIGGHHDRLAGQPYIIKHGDVNANVTVNSLSFLLRCVLSPQCFSALILIVV
jgi:hypothetical protein